MLDSAWQIAKNRAVALTAEDVLQQSIPNFEGFDILCELGNGTTGIVYKAIDLRNKQIVVLKTLYRAPSEDYHARAQRFRREVLAMAAVGGPNIVAMFMVGEDQGRPFCVREFVDGCTLEQRVQDHSIDLQRGIAILADVAGAVEQIHRRGLIHRNLVSSNVLISNEGTAKLIGFGLARAADDAAVSGPLKTPEIDIAAIQDMLRWLCTGLGQPMPEGLATIDSAKSPITAATMAEFLKVFLEQQRPRRHTGFVGTILSWLGRG